MWYVYIIRSIQFPDQEYTGASENPKQRPQRRAVTAHSKIQALEIGLVLRLPG
jgi:hypothetical protein